MANSEGLDLHAAFNGPREVDQSEWRVLTSLKSFQIIESVLKAYLCEQSTVGDESTGTLRYEAGDVLEWPLGKLLDHFKKLNDNEALIAMLDAVRCDRNLVAHQALVCQSNGLAEIIGAEVISLSRLKEIDRRALKAMTALVAEYIRKRSTKAA